MDSCGLIQPCERGVHRAVDLEAMVHQEVADFAMAVGDQPELEVVPTQFGHHRQRVVVEVEVGRLLPEPSHPGGEVAGEIRLAAHPTEDAFRQRGPQLVVVSKLRIRLRALDRRRPCLLIAGGVEPVLASDPLVAVGSEVWSRLREREVHVEKNGPDVHLQGHATPRAAGR